MFTGYSAGMIKMCVNKVLTVERINLKKEVLKEEDFIQELQELFKPIKQEEELCVKFTDAFYSKKKEKEKKKAKKKK